MRSVRTNQRTDRWTVEPSPATSGVHALKKVILPPMNTAKCQAGKTDAKSAMSKTLGKSMKKRHRNIDMQEM